jgi:PASTA domain
MLSTRSLAAALATVLAGALLVTGAAVATPTLDQQQTTLDMDRVFEIGGMGPQTLAQIVTSGTPGLLTQVELPVACDSSDLLVEIRESGTTIPGTRVLASQTVSGLAYTEEWKSIAFTTPAFIADETLFAIVLSSPGWCGIFAGPDGLDPYSRGAGLYKYPPYPWWPAGTDLGFKTYVEAVCQVPALVGSAQSVVSGMLEAHGCALGTVKLVFSRDVPLGDVIAQSQPEGTRLAPAGRVDLVVSRGPQQCKVPNVRRMTLARAKSKLKRAHCRAGSIRRVAAAKSMKGRVIRQKPAPGTQLPEGGRVSLVVGRR